VQQEYLYFPVQKSEEKNIKEVPTIIVDLKLLILQLFITFFYKHSYNYCVVNFFCFTSFLSKYLKINYSIFTRIY